DHLKTGDGSVTSMDAKENINVEETEGDLTVGKIKAGEDIKLNLDGSVKDTDSSDEVKKLADAIAKQEQAKAEAEALDKQKDIEQNYVDNLTDAVADAKEALKPENLGFTQQDIDDIKDALNNAGLTKKEKKQYEEQLKKYEDEINKIIDQASQTAGHDLDNIDTEKSIDEIIAALEAELDNAKNELAAIINAQSDAHTALDNANQQVADAEAAVANAESAIEAGGDIDITLKPDGTVGTEDNSLSVKTGEDKTLTIRTEDDSKLGDVHIESNDDLNLNPINSNGDVSVDVKGDITAADDSKPLISGDKAEINAIGGTVGNDDIVIKTDVNEISIVADEINISNDKDLVIDEIIAVKEPEDPQNPAKGDVTIDVKGDIEAGQSTDNNIIGKDVEIKAKGNIGEDSKPIKVDSDEISTDSKDVNISSDGDITVDKIKAKGDVNIKAGGSVTGKDKKSYINGNNVNIEAGGDIGSKDNPLSITAKKVNALSNAGRVYTNVKLIRNNKPSNPDEPDEGEGEGEDADAVFPMLKVTLPENRVALAARAKRSGKNPTDAQEDELNEDEKPQSEEKIEETKDDDRFAVISIPEIPIDEFTWIWLLLIALLGIGVVLLLIAKRNDRNEETKNVAK
ncbi:MAG: hypothetical protein Q4Q25_01985, partial [Methanocorpusculum sp.]|nr:hypothetical protein [Methanocorpusculum sp.]